MADRLEAGTPRDAVLYFSFEDERLEGMQAAQLQEYFQRFLSPSVQNEVPHWVKVSAAWEWALSDK